MATSIGMMDSAYFVGRNEILAWLNARLQLSLSRVEEVNAQEEETSQFRKNFPPFPVSISFFFLLEVNMLSSVLLLSYLMTSLLK